jgi:hypothetical protein
MEGFKEGQEEKFHTKVLGFYLHPKICQWTQSKEDA